jgi:YVTN family beta-propeller protein
LWTQAPTASAVTRAAIASLIDFIVAPPSRWVRCYELGRFSRRRCRSGACSRVPFCWVQGGAPAIAVAAGVDAVSPTSVYVTNLSNGTVSVIDPTTSMVVNTITVGTQPAAVAVAKGTQVDSFASANTLSRPINSRLPAAVRPVVAG